MSKTVPPLTPPSTSLFFHPVRSVLTPLSPSFVPSPNRFPAEEYGAFVDELHANHQY